VAPIGVPAGDLPVGGCPSCGREVLTHVHLGEDGAERRLCVHCDTVVELVRWVGEDGLADLGYGAADAAVGCGRPDCGMGRCGAGGGT
jgi:hypothetical protein